MTTTTYDIRVRYMLDDRASRQLARIDQNAGRAAKSTNALARTLRRLALGALGFMSFRLGKKLLIDYNAEIQQAKIQMAGLLQLNMGGDWARNQKRANFLVRQFQKDAKASVGTTKDFVDMGSMLTGPLSRAGASMAEITEITKGAVIASRAFGVNAEFAARDIEGALLGNLGKKDRFARALLEPQGITTKKWNEMVGADPKKAFKLLLDTFRQPAIQKMAAEQEKSWSGVTSTLEDNLQRAFAKVGIPLMQRMTAEVQKLNKWFDENPDKINQIASNIGNSLVKAFELAKATFSFIARHKDELLLIAKVALALKAVSLVSRGIMALPGLLSLSKAGEDAARGLTGVTGKLANFAGQLARGIGILATVYVGARAVADWIDKRQEERIKRETAAPLLAEHARLLGGAQFGPGTGISRGAARQSAIEARRQGLKADAGAVARPGHEATWGDIVRRENALREGRLTGADKYMARKVVAGARDAGFLGKNDRVNLGMAAGKFGVGDDTRSAMIMGLARRSHGGAFASGDPGKIAEALREVNAEFGDEEVTRMTQFLLGLDRALALDRKEKGGMWSFMMNYVVDAMETVKNGDSVANDRGGIKSNTNVKINKIEVVSDDPDRFAFQLVGAFEDFNKSPTQARRALAEGR